MHLTLHLTDACNLRCKYCYVRQDTHVMTPDTAKAAVDLAAGDPGHHGIIFFGGEPLLRRQLIYDTVQYAESLGLPGKFHYKITTNGTLLDDEFLAFSKRYQVFIALSHDGTAQDVCRVYPDGSGTFRQLEPTAKKLLRYRPYAPVMMTVSPATVSQYAEGVDYLYRLGFRYLICTIDYSGDWTEADFRMLERQYRRLADWYQALTLREEKFYFPPLRSKFLPTFTGAAIAPSAVNWGKSSCPLPRTAGSSPVCSLWGIRNIRLAMFSPAFSRKSVNGSMSKTSRLRPPVTAVRSKAGAITTAPV